MISILIVAAALFSPSYGQEFPSQNPGGIASLDSSRREASPIVRVSARDHAKPAQGDYMMDWGSGTIIADNGQEAIVFTNWHVIKDTVPPITVWTFGRGGFQALVIGKDVDNDLAALVIKSPGIRPVNLNLTGLIPRGAITVGGYGPNNQLRLVAGYPENHKWTQPGLLSIQAKVRQGDSGGPALSSDGRMIGVLWGGSNEGGQSTMVTSGEPFVRFHQSVVRDGRKIDLTSCQGGSCQMSGGQWQSCENGSCGQGSVYTDRREYSEQANVSGIKPLAQHPTIIAINQQLATINNSVSSLQRSSIVDKSSCTCEDKWTALETWKKQLEERVATIKSCNCDKTTATSPAPNTTELDKLTQTITQLNQTIIELKQENEALKNPPKTSTVEKDALTLEGIVTRVPKP